MLELEREFRTALLGAGAPVFAQLLQGRIDRIDADYQAGVSQVRMGRRSARVATLLGEVAIKRDYYHDAQRQAGHCPADAALGFEGLYTPALARLMCRAAAEQSYQEGSRDLAEYGGIEVDERQIQRMALRIGPAVAPWLKGYAGSRACSGLNPALPQCFSSERFCRAPLPTTDLFLFLPFPGIGSSL